MSTRSAVCLLVLCACTSDRPKHTYSSTWPEAGSQCDPQPGIPDPCGDAGVDSDDDEPSSDDAGLDATLQVPDAGPVGDTLEGTYLMRVDYYSTADGMDTTSGVRLTVKNRISNLFLTTLTAAGQGALQSSEQLCLQTSQHACQNNSCTGWTTTYDGDLPPLYAQKSKLQRTWLVDTASKTLTVKADGASLALGYDPNGADLSFPSALSDPNVWQPGTQSAQRAMHTYVKANVSTPLGSMPFSCNINTVMRFDTAFRGTLTELNAQGMNKLLLEVDAAGTDAVILDAKPPDTGALSSACNKSKLETGTSSDAKVVVRFVKTGLSACPATASAYDKAFNNFPSDNVDPPAL